MLYVIQCDNKAYLLTYLLTYLINTCIVKSECKVLLSLKPTHCITEAKEEWEGCVAC